MTTKAGGRGKNKKLVDVVNYLFDSGPIEELPEGFERIDPAELIREIGRQAQARSDEYITLPADSHCDEAKAVLLALSEGRGVVTGNEFDDAWRATRISMDFQVSGNEAWCPRILPNGSVAWRNFHRVIGFDNDFRGAIGVNVTALREELTELVAAVRKTKDPDLEDPTGFSLLHRDKEGLCWTRDIPESLSSFGQTLVTLPAGWIKLAAARSDRWAVLGSPLLQQTSESSRRGMAVLRIFKDRVFVYGLYRADDSYDTILERFGDDLGGRGPDGQCSHLTVTNDFYLLKDRIAKSLRQAEPDLFQNLFVDEVTHFLAGKALFDDYARDKTYQILHWMPVFSDSPSTPASDRVEPLAFLDQAAQLDFHLVIVQFPSSLVKKIRGLGAAVSKLIRQAIPESLLDGASVHIPDRPLLPNEKAGDEWIFKFGSPEAQLRFDALEAQWKKACREEKKLYGSDEESFLLNQEIKFAVLLNTRETDPAYWHSIGLAASEAVNGGVHIVIPSYGYYQGYDCGDLDTGNHDKFVDRPA